MKKKWAITNMNSKDIIRILTHTNILLEKRNINLFFLMLILIVCNV